MCIEDALDAVSPVFGIDTDRGVLWAALIGTHLTPLTTPLKTKAIGANAIGVIATFGTGHSVHPIYAEGFCARTSCMIGWVTDTADSTRAFATSWFCAVRICKTGDTMISIGSSLTERLLPPTANMIGGVTG